MHHEEQETEEGFDPGRGFSSPEEAIDYARNHSFGGENLHSRVAEIVASNIQSGELGFASEVLELAKEVREKPVLREWTVELTRKSWRQKTVEVRASSAAEAEEIALEEDDGDYGSEKDAGYSAEAVEVGRQGYTGRGSVPGPAVDYGAMAREAFRALHAPRAALPAVEWVYDKEAQKYVRTSTEPESRDA